MISLFQDDVIPSHCVAGARSVFASNGELKRVIARRREIIVSKIIRNVRAATGRILVLRGANIRSVDRQLRDTTGTVFLGRILHVIRARCGDVYGKRHVLSDRTGVQRGSRTLRKSRP